jgi:hypothetical protein
MRWHGQHILAARLAPELTKDAVTNSPPAGTTLAAYG